VKNIEIESKDEISEDEELSLIREENGKYLPVLFALIVSIMAILFDTDNLQASIYPTQPSLNGALVAVAFLVAWIFFGTFMGYTQKNSFMKVVSLYWGIGCLLYLIGELADSTTSFSLLKVLMLPFYILFLTPTYGLGYYYGNISLLNIISSWSAGAIGFLIGYLLNELRVSTLPNK